MNIISVFDFCLNVFFGLFVQFPLTPSNMSQRDRRAIPRIDYAALEAAHSPTALNSSSLENGRPAEVNSLSTIVQMPSSQVESHQPVPTNIESLRAALAAAKAENEQLVRNSEFQALQQELSSLQQQNALPK